MNVDKQYEDAIASLKSLLGIDGVEKAMGYLPRDDTLYIARELENKHKESGHLRGSLVTDPLISLCQCVDDQTRSEVALRRLQKAIAQDRKGLDTFLNVLQEGYYWGLLRRVPLSEIKSQ